VSATESKVFYMNEQIKSYFEQSDSFFVDIATVLDPGTGEIFLMLAPEYSFHDNDDVYDESGDVFEVLHYETFSKDDHSLKMIDDLNRGATILIAKGRIERKDF